VKVLEAVPDGDGYRCALVDAERPVPAAGEVLVRVEASGLNRADLSQIAGRYPPPPGEPATLGLELSGTVVDSGGRVCALVAGGAHAEYAAVPKGQVLPVPGGTTLRDAAAIPEAFLTAYLNLVVEGGLARGKRALVHAGASGVGLAAIQTARWLGAIVAATTRSASKLEALRQAGADPAIDTSAGPFEEAIVRAWGRESVDVILDPVGAATLAGDLDVLALEGRIVFLATMSGARAELDIARLMGRRGRVIGSTLRSRSREDKARLVERFRAEMLPGFDAGALRVAVDSTFPPESAGEAFSRMRQNQNAGKILLDWTRVGKAG
jgi:putative PIG3 family NAD(P)H quinone oxidoreductase